MSRSVDKIKHIILAIDAVIHLYGMALYSNASLSLQIHVIKHLSLKILTCNSVGILQQTVGKCAFAVVNMGYYAEVANIFHCSVKYIAKVRIIFRLKKCDKIFGGFKN